MQFRLLSAWPVRWVMPALYVAALSAYMWREGIPVGRERLLVWIVLGLLALSTANLGGWVRGVVFEWLPLALVLAAYDLLRGHADGLLFSAWYRPQLEADSFLFGGTVPTVWLQDQLWHGSSDLRWYDYASWAVYVSYFVVTYLLAGLLWFFAHARFRRYVGSVALLAGMGFATFTLFPAAPPWLASREGELDWTVRLIGPISGHIPFLSLSFEGVWERGSEYSNPVAAVPSLHAAYTLLITLFLWRAARWAWARAFLALYPPAMAFALVYTAEHYLVDILLGWAYTLAAVWVVGRIADCCKSAGTVAVMLGVRLTVVRNEMEAAAICGLLRTEGIACNDRQTDMGVGATDSTGSGGPREILVAESDLERARELVKPDNS